jgi:adenylosuccinate synthase
MYKRIRDLVHGDVTREFGTVTHREDRKVWFDNRVVTFNSADEEIILDHSVTAQ